jgi:hypothetical protein
MLVVAGAAAVAMSVLTWLSAGGGAGPPERARPGAGHDRAGDRGVAGHGRCAHRRADDLVALQTVVTPYFVSTTTVLAALSCRH